MPPRGKLLALTTAALALAVLIAAAWLSWPHLRFWWLFESLGKNAQGYPEYRHRKTGIVMVRVPGGKFWMGAQREDPKGPNYEETVRGDEGPVHNVRLNPFLIGKYEVTQTQWRAVMGTNPSEMKGDDHPVEKVSWYDCQGFCGKTGVRLPTEAQWEYACRAGSGGVFCFGSDSERLDEYAWFKDNSGDVHHPVGLKAPNGFGLHDMHGNVAEWCEDEVAVGFYSKPEASGPDPFSKSTGWTRGHRGGNAGLSATGCGCARRDGTNPAYNGGGVGFRPIFYPLL